MVSSLFSTNEQFFSSFKFYRKLKNEIPVTIILERYLSFNIYGAIPNTFPLNEFKQAKNCQKRLYSVLTLVL